MGNAVSMVVRKARRFNVENRAHRVLDQEKPTVAPKFESNVRELQKVLDDNPEWVQEQGKKSASLDDRLKQVYVTSTEPETVPLVRPGADDAVNPTAPSSSRALPLDRKPVDDFEYGYKEPMKVSRGRATLRQAIQFITDHQTDPEVWSAKRIADEYKLKESIVDDILRNFHTFGIFIPDLKKKENVLINTKHSKMLAAQDSQNRPKQNLEFYDEMEDKLTGGKLK